MKRTRYFKDTAPGEDQFNYGEQSTGDALLERFKVISSMGVYSGLTVTVNGLNNTQVDVGLGEGYCPNGERIYVDTPSSAGIPLINYSDGALNYITLRYVEAGGVPLIERFTQPPATPVQHNTLFADSYDVEVLDYYQWIALTTTQLRERLLAAIVTARGVGIALSSADIQLPTVFAPALYTSQLVLLTGVTVIKVSSNTFEGYGTLSYQFTTSGTTVVRTLKWRAPSDPNYGSEITIAADGQINLTNYSGNSYITVDIVMGFLSTITPVTENIQITNLYVQEISRYSAVDAQHRAMLGTGSVAATNPHGMALADLGGETTSVVADHQNLMHSNGILRGSAIDCLKATIVPGPYDSINITPLVVGDAYYIKGLKLITVGAASVDFSDVGLLGATKLYTIRVDEKGMPDKYLRATHPDPTTIKLPDIYLTYLSPGIVAGNYPLSFNIVNGNGLLQFGGSGVNVNIPLANSYYTLPITGSKEYAIVYVNALPISTGLVDYISVAAPLDSNLYMELAFVHYLATGGDLAFITDRRLYGTLTENELRDDLIRDNVATQINELRSDGVASGCLVSANGPSSIMWTSGVVYVQGRRIQIATDVINGISDGDWYVYCDIEGHVLISAVSNYILKPTVGAVLNKINVAVSAGKVTVTPPPDPDRVVIGDLDKNLRSFDALNPGAGIIGYNTANANPVPALPTVQSALDAMFNAFAASQQGQQYYRIRAGVLYNNGNTVIVRAGRVLCKDVNGNLLPLENIVDSGSSFAFPNIANAANTGTETPPLAATIYYCYAVVDGATTHYKVVFSHNEPNNDRLCDFTGSPDAVIKAWGWGRYLGAIRTQKSSIAIEPFTRSYGSPSQLMYGMETIFTGATTYNSLLGPNSSPQILIPKTATKVFVLLSGAGNVVANASCPTTPGTIGVGAVQIWQSIMSSVGGFSGSTVASGWVGVNSAQQLLISGSTTADGVSNWNLLVGGWEEEVD